MSNVSVRVNSVPGMTAAPCPEKSTVVGSTKMGPLSFASVDAPAPAGADGSRDSLRCILPEGGAFEVFRGGLPDGTFFFASIFLIVLLSLKFIYKTNGYQ